MDKLYAPWRDCYVQNHIKNNKQADKECCIFCDVFLENISEEDRFILFRNDTIAIMLNLYPYNAGHVMIFAKQHTDQLYNISEDVLHTLISVIAKSMRLIEKELACEAINFGANIGRIAGAGIPDHVHMHIVPRWQGDTGFFPVIAQTKQISVDLEKMYARLKPVFDKEFLDK